MYKWRFHKLIVTHPLLQEMQKKHLLALTHYAELVAFDDHEMSLSLLLRWVYQRQHLIRDICREAL